jgi:hypothetical protein
MLWARVGLGGVLSVRERGKSCRIHLDGMSARDESPSSPDTGLDSLHGHVEGETSTDYVAEETPMPSYLALHQAFERLRASAVAPSTAVTLNQDESLGPQVLFIGEKDSGKTTLIKTLANWAIRAGRARTDVLVAAKDEPDEGEGKSRGVMLVNLDPSEVSLCLSHREKLMLGAGGHDVARYCEYSAAL